MNDFLKPAGVQVVNTQPKKSLQSHRCYNIIVKTLTQSGEIPVDPNCNGFVCVNESNVLVTINNFPLKPFPPGHPELSGESYGVSGNTDEIYKGRIVINFSSPPTAGEVIVVQKYFID